MTIRIANLKDAESITSLSDELGYNPTSEQIKSKIVRFSSNENDQIYIAEENKQVVGWMHISLVEPLESVQFVEVRGIVVDKNYRGQGIGSQLIKFAEKWANEKQCNKVRIRTNIMRIETRDYYSKLGFKSMKTQEVFEKKL